MITWATSAKKVNKSSTTLERNFDVFNKTKTMAQGRIGFDRRTRTYLRRKHVTLKRTKHATNFSFKFLSDFLEVRGFSPDILTWMKKGTIGNTRLRSTNLLSGDSQHINYKSVTIWVCNAKIVVRVLTRSVIPFGSFTFCQNPDYYFGIIYINIIWSSDLRLSTRRYPALRIKFLLHV